MNLTAHIVRKDFRANRLTWILWIALVAVQLLVALTAFSARNALAGAYSQLMVGIDALALVWSIFGYLLTAAVVLQDSPVGTKAFWLTRPVSGVRMLASKALWVLAFIVVAPALTAIPWGIYCHFGAAGIAQALLRTSLFTLFLAAPAFVMAVLAGSWSRFLLYNLVVMAAVWVVVVTLAGVSPIYRPTTDTVFLAGALLCLFEACAIFHQYVRRQWPTSLCIAVIGFLLTIGVFFGPTPMKSHGRDHPAAVPFAAEVGAKIGGNPYSYPVHNGDSVGINFHIEITGVPDDLALAPGAADIELKWADGSHYREADVPLRSRYLAQGFAVRTVLKLPDSPLFGGDPETLDKVKGTYESYRRRFHERNPNKPQLPMFDYMHSPKRGGLDYTADLIVTPETARKIQALTPSCTVTAYLFLIRPEIVATIPLDQVGQVVADGARIHILSAGVSFDPNGKRSYLEDSVVYSAPPAASLAFFEYDRDFQTEDEFKDGGSYRGLSQEGLPFVPLGHISVRTPVARLWRTDHWADDPTWSRSVRLAAVHFVSAGGVTREIQLDRLVLNVADKSP